MNKNTILTSLIITILVFSIGFLSCEVPKTSCPIRSEGNQVWGIDISHHQGKINWNKLSQRSPHFLFMKATEGVTHKDTRYVDYRKAANKRDIPIGAYHFFSYTSDGSIQAEHFLRFAKPQTGDLLPVLDCEFRKRMPSKTNVTRELLKFIRTIEQELGVSPIIYCEVNYYNRYLKKDLGNDYPLWICDFRKEPNWDYAFWQKTDRFRHSAFRGRVDYNEFSGTIEELSKYKLK